MDQKIFPSRGEVEKEDSSCGDHSALYRPTVCFVLKASRTISPINSSHVQ